MKHIIPDLANPSPLARAIRAKREAAIKNFQMADTKACDTNQSGLGVRTPTQPTLSQGGVQIALRPPSLQFVEPSGERHVVGGFTTFAPVKVAAIAGAYAREPIPFQNGMSGAPIEEENMALQLFNRPLFKERDAVEFTEIERQMG
jgi:hypothetical protein